VKYIPSKVSKEEVEKEFKKAGPIASIRLKNYES
jgi:RNA recognition motif-containing protein